ncbi:NACHT, LRR and PYD domains-containing protein 3 isoform X4 [Danio rerio]|uniref:NACHT, LRR and PYD domains-containing protein 3 isoform X4 n=1 Tax=Danio rerio TaxID=7955 RepID=A0AC58JFA5_DANRE
MNLGFSKKIYIELHEAPMLLSPADLQQVAVCRFTLLSNSTHNQKKKRYVAYLLSAPCPAIILKCLLEFLLDITLYTSNMEDTHSSGDQDLSTGCSSCKRRRAEAEPSCVSLKSDQSMLTPLSFRSEHTQPAVRDDQTGDLQQDLLQPEHDELQRVKEQHKTSMKNKYERLFEGIHHGETPTLLNRIYTQLYIIEGESEGVNEEHEVLQMEKRARTEPSQHTPVYCNDIFKASAGAGHEEKIKKEKAQIKTVLTKGIAGIGKTVSVQKFILDWAEGKDHQDVDFMFVLPFRELNLIRDHQYSLHRLLLAFHPELEDLEPKIYEQCRVVFIFDGLDESRIALNFSDEEKVCAVTESSSVAVLMRSLLKGDLLPSALIWITSRPAAAHQIPSRYIKRLTEIQGFTEPQKEEYFRKRISDKRRASRIISHIRRARSLQIMCHIPVFCWISSTVLQKLLEEDSCCDGAGPVDKGTNTFEVKRIQNKRLVCVVSVKKSTAASWKCCNAGVPKLSSGWLVKFRVNFK